jgi:hypothetical protein
MLALADRLNDILLNTSREVVARLYTYGTCEGEGIRWAFQALKLVTLHVKILVCWAGAASLRSSR